MYQNTNSQTRDELLRVATIIAILAIIVFTGIYFLVATAAPTEGSLLKSLQGFILGMILNIIPVLLVFVASYYLWRRLQDSWTADDRSELAHIISKDTSAAVKNELAPLI